MAKVRVSTLAKEFGMTSKELMGHLADMKIPAKSASSTLEDAYVAMVRKQLASVIEARAQEVEAAKQAEEQAAAAEEAARAAEAERERIAAEKAREEERRQFAAAQAAEEAARAEAEAKKKAEQERLAREKEEAAREAQRRAVPASDSGSRFRSLLDQIAAQETVLKEKKDAEDKAKAERAAERGNRRGGNNDRRGGRRNDRNASDDNSERSASESRPHSHRTNASNNVAAGMDFPNPDKQGKGKKRKGGHNNEEDHYSRMAREAEEYSREKVLEEARAAVEEASRESTGRRKKRKEKREREAAKAQEERKIEEALAQGVNPEELDAIKVSQGVTVQELAEALDVPANDIIKRLFLLGTPLTMTQSMSDDLVELVADDLGRQIKIITPEEENTFSFYDDPADLKPRAPVVTVMGHVDHGKTSLLDYIRHAKVAAGEAGGITQHIGAYTVEINGQPITFLDTPGHAAFTEMRARGAMCTDIAILVVAADDGIMPQTIEAINHAKAAKIPIIVAVNKMDKHGANPDRILTQLTEHGLTPAEWGGETEVCKISAKTGMGIDELLETVILTAEMEELKANPNRAGKGCVLEARLDKNRGPIATLLVQNGTLRQSDLIIAGTAVGRVRVMTNDKGAQVKEAGPSVPVEITGLAEVPSPGDEFSVVSDERMARQLVEQRKQKIKDDANKLNQKVTLESLFSKLQEGEMKELNLIVKADVQGSAEAVKASLEKLSNEEVRVRVIHAGVGAINESDILLASTSNAIVIGFNVRPNELAQAAAKRDKVDMRMYRVIYDAINEITDAMKGMLAPKFREAIIGHAEVRQTYKVSAIGTIAGCYVKDGKITRDASVRVLRDNIVIHEGKLGSLQRFKDAVKEVAAGYECGMSIEKFNDIKEGDIFECFVMEQIKE